MMRTFSAAAVAVGFMAASPVVNAADLRQCMVDAGKRFGVHPGLIWAVAKTESHFRANAINPSNKDGSEDIGLMQINTWWLMPRAKPSDPKRLADYGFTRAHLMDPCTNIYAGTWILSQSIKRHGITWKAVGEYNAVTPWKQQAYAEKVRINLADALRQRSAPAAADVVVPDGVQRGTGPAREMRVISEVASR